MPTTKRLYSIFSSKLKLTVKSLWAHLSDIANRVELFLRTLDHPLWGYMILPTVFVFISTYHPAEIRIISLFIVYLCLMIALRRSRWGSTKGSAFKSIVLPCTLLFIISVGAVKIYEFLDRPVVNIYLTDHHRWKMASYGTRQLTDDLSKSNASDFVVKNLPDFDVINILAGPERLINVIVVNEGRSHLKNAVIDIQIFSRGGILLNPALDPMSNDGHRFSPNEVTYEFLDIPPSLDSGLANHLSLRINSLDTINVFMVVTVHADSFNKVYVANILFQH